MRAEQTLLEGVKQHSFPNNLHLMEELTKAVLKNKSEIAGNVLAGSDEGLAQPELC